MVDIYMYLFVCRPTSRHATEGSSGSSDSSLSGPLSTAHTEQFDQLKLYARQRQQILEMLTNDAKKVLCGAPPKSDGPGFCLFYLFFVVNKQTRMHSLNFFEVVVSHAWLQVQYMERETRFWAY